MKTLEAAIREMNDPVEPNKLTEAVDDLLENLDEEFNDWTVQFAGIKYQGKDVDTKKVHKVKARNTVEAIKKAAKAAGFSGPNDWINLPTGKIVNMKYAKAR